MIGFVDADILTGRSKFPNLALMKLAGFYKSQGKDTKLLFYNICEEEDKVHKFEYIEELYAQCEKIFISKVFKSPPLPDRYLNNKYGNVNYAGTGSINPGVRLDKQIEASQYPDYNIYNEYTEYLLSKGKRKIDLQYYYDYSIGFITRGCFRKCPFCVNAHYNKVEKCSDLQSFFDGKRKYLCLLDDNFLGYKDWERELDKLESIDKPFQFKQGLDFRIMTDHMMDRFINTRYHGDYIYAFDNIRSKNTIVPKLKIWRNKTGKPTKFYVLTGYQNYENEQDIRELMDRIEILGSFKCIPFVMKHENFRYSPLRQMYTDIARWANQPAFFKRMSFSEFCENDNRNITRGKICASLRSYRDFIKKYPEFKHLFTKKMFT